VMLGIGSVDEVGTQDELIGQRVLYHYLASQQLENCINSIMSSQLTQRGSIDVESEMAPQEPQPWIIRSTAWLLMAAFPFALVIAIVMRLPESVRCPFVLVPATGADPIQAPHQAVISHVAVSEGQTVKS